MHESYRNSLPLHSVGVDEERSSLENNGSSRGSYDILTIDGKVLSYCFVLFPSFFNFFFFFQNHEASVL